jgi:hypothetical protein
MHCLVSFPAIATRVKTANAAKHLNPIDAFWKLTPNNSQTVKTDKKVPSMTGNTAIPIANLVTQENRE